MPLLISDSLPTVLIRKSAFEAGGLTRTELDQEFNLTDAEFRMENNLIALGPMPHDDMVAQAIGFLEERGLIYFEDFFELSGNWPTWLALYARGE